MRKNVGDWGRGVRFIVNGERYSPSTSSHTNLVISACKPNVQIPYSGLHAAGLTESRFGSDVSPHPDLRVVAKEEDRWYPVCRTCGKDADPENRTHHADLSDICSPKDEGEPWRYEHVLGGVVISFGGSYYLSGIDQNEPWRLRSYFLCQLPHEVKSINEAFESLKPERVREAEASHTAVRRQGDIFLVRLNEKDWNLKLQYGRDMLVKDHRLWDTTHVASRALLIDGRVFVSGKITHERGQHRTLFCKGLWYEAVKDTALASWNVAGSVD